MTEGLFDLQQQSELPHEAPPSFATKLSMVLILEEALEVLVGGHVMVHILEEALNGPDSRRGPPGCLEGLERGCGHALLHDDPQRNVQVAGCHRAILREVLVDGMQFRGDLLAFVTGCNRAILREVLVDGMQFRGDLLAFQGGTRGDHRGSPGKAFEHDALRNVCGE